MDAEGLKILIEVTKTVLTGFGIWLAWQGLNTWREQLRGSGRYDTARKVLRNLFAVRNGITFVRTSTFREYETERAQQQAKERGIQDNREAVQHLLHDNRWRSIAEPLSELESALVDGEVHWGPAFADAFDPLRQIITELGLNLSYYLDGIFRPELQQSHGPAEWRRIAGTAIAPADPNAPDAFGQRARQLINDLEVMVRQRLAEE